MRARLLILSFVLFMLVLALPHPAEAENAFIEFLQDQEIIADMTIQRGEDREILLDAEVTIDIDYSATVTFSARASTWTCAADPVDMRVLPGITVIQVSGLFIVPANASEDSYTASIFATWDTPQGTPITRYNGTAIEVVQNRVIMGTAPGNFSVPAGSSYNITMPVTNHGTRDDNFVITTWAEDNGVINPNIVLTPVPSTLSLEAGETDLVQVQILVPEDLPSGDHTLIIRAVSQSDSMSTQQTEAVWSSTVTSMPAPVSREWGSLLPISLVVVFGSAMLFLSLTEVGIFAIATLLIPMYVRVKRDKVLDNFTRGAIFGYIKGNPGCTLTEIMESAGSGNGATTYHLSVLLREEFIVTSKDGLHRRFFPIGHPDRKKKFFPSRLQKDIIQYLRAHPGSSQTAVAHSLDESKQVVNYHVKILAENGLLALDNRGRKTLCYAKEIPEESLEPVVTVLAKGADA